MAIAERCIVETENAGKYYMGNMWLTNEIFDGQWRIDEMVYINYMTGRADPLLVCNTKIVRLDTGCTSYVDHKYNMGNNKVKHITFSTFSVPA